VPPPFCRAKQRQLVDAPRPCPIASIRRLVHDATRPLAVTCSTKFESAAGLISCSFSTAATAGREGVERRQEEARQDGAPAAPSNVPHLGLETESRLAGRLALHTPDRIARRGRRASRRAEIPSVPAPHARRASRKPELSKGLR